MSVPKIALRGSASGAVFSSFAGARRIITSHGGLSHVIPIVSIVGKSNVGKTTLLEKIIRELTTRGYRIASVKHDAHSFEIDHEGKDSWRHKHAGAVTTVISSREKVAVVADTQRDLTLDELRERFITDADLILSEGYKRERHPKIEVFRAAHHPRLLCGADDHLTAIAGDRPSDDCAVPVFDLEDVGPLCDFLISRFIKGGDAVVS
jgi:molybdopterin-guanine dinucleotide biosynthesis protein MobB